MTGYRLGIDIGGTFTDLVLAGDDGAVAVLKVPSTPDDYARGVLDGVRRLLELAGQPAQQAAEVVHGTTVATNTLVQRRGARTGLLTTRGFRDILEIQRLRVPRLYDLTWEKPRPLVPRAWRLEIDERLDHTGAVLRPLDEAGAVKAIDQLAGQGVEAIAACLLHSYANPAHEARLGELVRERAPHVYCTLSHEVLPRIQEYERVSTTVINAYLGPSVSRYLERMAAGLESLGVRAPLLVMQSNGGTMTAAAARKLPAQLVESGPAAGVIAAAALARASQLPSGDVHSTQMSEPGSRPGCTSCARHESQMLLTLDMGGTTAKAALLQQGHVPLAAEAEIGAGMTVANRLNRGGGYLLSLPSVDLAEVGTGGGSLLWIDSGGALCVGPQSAGAVPGPVCYAAGGTVPTLTDANVMLGYLNPRWLLGGALRLDAVAARQAIVEQIARPLGLAPEAAAYGAHTIAVASMVRAVRAVSAERGYDPQAATLVAFGGNGPLHAAGIAQELGIPRVLIPPVPGVFSAFGLLAAEVEHHFLRTYLRRLDQVDPAALAALFSEMEQAALTTLAAEGYPTARVDLRWSADLRYLGQSYELSVPLAVRQNALADPSSIAALEHAFGDAHEEAYGYRADGEPVELVNVRVVARGQPSTPRQLPPASTPSHSWRDTGGASAVNPAPQRAAYFGPDHGWLETPVLVRAALDRGGRAGPLIIEEYDATTLVPPAWHASLDEQGGIVLEPSRSR